MSETAAAPKKGISRRTIIIIVVVLILLLGGGGGAWYFINKSNQKKTLDQAKEKTKSDSKAPATDKPADKNIAQKNPPARPNASANDNFPLQKGSVGENILYLKKGINDLLPVGYTKLKEDTIFDSQTYSYLLTQFGTKYYPVTEDIWIEIMNKSNAPKTK